MQILRFLFLLLFLILTGSCSKNSIQENDINLNDINSKVNNQRVSDFGTRTVNFLSSLIKDDFNNFQFKVQIFQSKLNGLKDSNKNDVISIYSEIFKIDRSEVESYFNFLLVNKDLISKSNRKLLINELSNTFRSQSQLYIKKGDLEERGIFSGIVKLFGGGCSVQVVGYIADAATSAALGLATAETGIGLAVGLGNAAVNYGLAIQTALNCQ